VRPEAGPAGNRLRRAILELAGEQAVDTLNVSQVCRAAGITRDSFYRYAASPVELLAAELDADLEEFSRLADDVPEATTQGTVLDGTTRALLDHLRRNQSVYRRSLRPRLPVAMREVLLRRVEGALMAHATRHPGIVPAIGGAPASPAEVRLLATYAASGAVGVLESLLQLPADLDVERAALLVHTATAPWWLGTTPPSA
jgi:AcrR family transcriptional regulator